MPGNQAPAEIQQDAFMTNVVSQSPKVELDRSPSINQLTHLPTVSNRELALTTSASALTDAQWHTRVLKDGRKIGVVVHHVASLHAVYLQSAVRWLSAIFVFLVNPRVSIASSIERVGWRWLWKRCFGASQGHNRGDSSATEKALTTHDGRTRRQTRRAFVAGGPARIRPA